MISVPEVFKFSYYANLVTDDVIGQNENKTSLSRVKGVRFFNKRYIKGVLFLPKWYIKGERIGPRGGAIGTPQTIVMGLRQTEGQCFRVS